MLGVDIGGTKIASALLEEDGTIVKQSEVPSDATDKEKMFAQVIKGIEEVLGQAGISINEVLGIGVGVAGKVDRENGIAVYQNNLPWANFPLAQRLKSHFEIENVVINNDVTVATYAEWDAANVKEDETFVYLTVSTGVSCATIHNGTYLSGAGFSGELGLLPVVNGSASKAIERLEKISSGPAIQRVAREIYQDETLTTSEVFEKYLQDDEEAKKILSEAIEALAHGVYAVICLLDPHKVVIGGGVFNHQPYLLALVKEALEGYLIEAQLPVLERIELSRLKGNAGIVGAGLLGRDCIPNRST